MSKKSVHLTKKILTAIPEQTPSCLAKLKKSKKKSQFINV